MVKSIVPMVKIYPARYNEAREAMDMKKKFRSTHGNHTAHVESLPKCVFWTVLVTLKEGLYGPLIHGENESVCLHYYEKKRRRRGAPLRTAPSCFFSWVFWTESFRHVILDVTVRSSDRDTRISMTLCIPEWVAFSHLCNTQIADCIKEKISPFCSLRELNMSTATGVFLQFAPE